MEDPFFVVQDEVVRSLERARSLLSAGSGPWLEARNALRSIEWDLEDLQDTLNILTENPDKFGLSKQQLQQRQLFVAETSAKLQRMQRRLKRLENPEEHDHESDDNEEEEDTNKTNNNNWSRGQYERVKNESPSKSCRRGIDVSTLEELGGQIERAETKLDATMQRLSTVFSNGRDRRHWLLMGTCSSIFMLIVLIIFAL